MRGLGEIFVRVGFNIHLWKRSRSVFVQLGRREARTSPAGYKQVGRGFRKLMVVADTNKSLRV